MKIQKCPTSIRNDSSQYIQNYMCFTYPTWKRNEKVQPPRSYIMSIYSPNSTYQNFFSSLTSNIAVLGIVCSDQSLQSLDSTVPACYRFSRFILRDSRLRSSSTNGEGESILRKPCDTRDSVSLLSVLPVMFILFIFILFFLLCLLYLSVFCSFRYV